MEDVSASVAFSNMCLFWPDFIFKPHATMHKTQEHVSIANQP